MTDERPSEPADAALIAAVRTGDQDAYGELFRRHAVAATRLARVLTHDHADADDLVAEAFARIFPTLTGGSGPELAFRPYLLTTVRNLFQDAARRAGRTELAGDVAEYDPGVPIVDTAVAGLEPAMVARAFVRLPERWRLVLWHTAVEGESPAAVAPLLGVTPHAVSTLAHRAREALREHYLQEHITTRSDGECRWAADHLGAHTRQGLSRPDRQRLDRHLSGCRACHLLWIELAEVNATLGALIAPVILGVATTGYGLAVSSTASTAVAAANPPTSVDAAANATGLGPGVRRVARRRSTRLTAAALAILVLLALGWMLRSSPTSAPAAAQPGPAPAAGSSGRPTSGASAGTSAPAGPGRANGTSSTVEPGTPVTLTAQIEPVGALVRGRPGVLALTVLNSAPPIGSGLVRRSAPGYTGARPTATHAASGVPHSPTDTGALTALVDVPAGVTLRGPDAGDGWSCATQGAALRCERPSLPANATTRGFIPVSVSTTADPGTVSVQLSGSNARPTGTTSARGVLDSGLAAVLAATRASTVVVGGNSLLTCPSDLTTCVRARTGEDLTDRTDNGDYSMTTYVDPTAPGGAPADAAVSGAAIPLPGAVVFAGLYWAGSGDPPDQPTAYLHSPAGSEYVGVAAARVDRVSTADFGQSAYQAFAEVTDLVRAAQEHGAHTNGSAGTGDTWFLAVEPGAFHGATNVFGGWALLAVVDDGGPLRTIAVFDGCTALQGTQTFSAAVHGTPDGPAQVGFIGWEGDRGISGDQIRLGPLPLGGPDADNLLRGTAAGTPGGWNTFGVDARVLNGRLPAAADHQTVTAATSGDAWLLGAIAVVTPA